MTNLSLQKYRWLIAAAAVVMQLCLGTVYAWSVFKKPLMAAHGWTETATQITFMICIGMTGICAAFGGMLVDKKGPRIVATVGGVLFGVGTIIAGLADYTGNIFLLYIGYGFIAGCGNGLAYITPIAILIRWFPDKRGLVTGLAVMGFGAGAFFMGQVAPAMINQTGIASTWFILGAIFLILTVAMARFLENPPQDWLPQGFVPKTANAATVASSWNFSEAFATRQWWILWAVFFLNISAGIGLLSQLSPMAQAIQNDIINDSAKLAVAGGVVVSIASLFNGFGRLFWAWLSDGLGRKTVFIIMLISGALLYFALPQIKNVTLFTVVACYLLACYGGGFSVMPALVADSFGPAHVGRIYGAILTAWGAAGIVGPLIFACLKDSAIYVAAGMLIIGLLFVIVYEKPAGKFLAGKI
ncbi:MAG: OFA family MFS transporter [Kiritimatiellia bacterium]|nr:OFA family MFS transporter [Kiritimatiellia bacterium]